MHLGFMIYGDVDTRTGGFRYDRRLATALRDRGHEVAFVELHWRRYPVGLLEGVVGRPIARLDRVLEKPVDVVLQDELAHPSLVACNGRLRDRVDAPVVAVVHHLRASEAHPAALDRVYRAIERRYLAGVDGVVCNSHATRRTILRLASPPGLVAPPAGDRFEPDIDDHVIERRAHDDTFRVAFVGQLVPRKGVDTLLAAVGDREGCEVTLVGSLTTEPTYVDRLKRQIRRLGIEHRVAITGELPDDDLAAVLRRSHAIAMPSRHEGYGIAYLEGMRFGLPAIATTAGGAPDIVTDGETGFLVAPDDPDAVADAIGTLATDRDGLTRMGQAARRRAEAQPDWDDTADAVEAFLDRIADGHPPAARHVEGTEHG